MANPTDTDVVRVVRCKYCAYFHEIQEGKTYCEVGFPSPEPSDYCSCGFRKNGDDCSAYGMSGNSGPACPEYGMRDGCKEGGVDDEDVKDT